VTVIESLPAKNKGGRASRATPEVMTQIKSYQKEGKSQHEIADLIGERQSTISRWLKADKADQDIPF
jgi:IS30 family transposase